MRIPPKYDELTFTTRRRPGPQTFHIPHHKLIIIPASILFFLSIALSSPSQIVTSEGGGLMPHYDSTNQKQLQEATTTSPSRSRQYRETLLRARQEAQCLQNYGGQPFISPSTFSKQPTFRSLAYAYDYTPFLCNNRSAPEPNSNNLFPQCEICRAITEKPRSNDECSTFCREESLSSSTTTTPFTFPFSQRLLEFCQRLCLQMNRAVHFDLDHVFDQNQKSANNDNNNNENEEGSRDDNMFAKGAFPSQGESNGKPTTKEGLVTRKYAFSMTPHVFCEAVLPTDGGEEMMNNKEKESYKSKGLKPIAANNNHFVVLKWDIIEEGGSKVSSSSKETDSSQNQSLSKPTQGRGRESPIVFVIERSSNGNGRSKNSSQKIDPEESGPAEEEDEEGEAWEVLGKTPYNLQSLSGIHFSTQYKWRVTAVSEKGVLGSATSAIYQTLNGYKKPRPPKRIYIAKTLPIPSNTSIVNVLIAWDPPDENSCHYKIILETHEGSDEKPIRIREPLGVHQYWFTLQAGVNYSVLITSRDASWSQQSESSFTRLDFSTPTCLQNFNYSFQKCVPPSPRDVVSTLFLHPTSGNSGTLIGLGGNMTAQLTWKPPLNASVSNPVLLYNITFIRLIFPSPTKSSSGHQLSPPPHKNVSSSSKSSFSKQMQSLVVSNLFSVSNKTSAVSLTVPGNLTKLEVVDLEANADYQVLVRAIGSKGSSPPARHHLVTRHIVKEREETTLVSLLGNWLLYIILPLVTFLLLILGWTGGRVIMRKRKVKFARNQYFQSMDERDVYFGPDWSIVPLTTMGETCASTWNLFDENFPKERWEVLGENLVMGRVIGQGAFGIVRHAKIPRSVVKSSILKYIDRSKQSPSEHVEEEDLNSSQGGSFYENEESASSQKMESVAVKMLKVSATREDREQLVKEIMTMQGLGFHRQIVGLIGVCTRGRILSLVLEYCPGGDLLTYVRKVRSKYWPTLGLAEAKSADTSLPSKESLRKWNNNSNATSAYTGSGNNLLLLGNGTTAPLPDGDKDNNNAFPMFPRPTQDPHSPINYADLEYLSTSSSSTCEAVTNGGRWRDANAGSGLTTPLASPTATTCKSMAGSDSWDEEWGGRPLDEKDVLSYARQIAMGMEYLEKNRIVHRDLACRNCLLMGDRRQVKLSDFGLSRDIYTWNVYHQKSSGKLPIKWMSIESIFTHVFSTKSDVWSYGIVLWELVTLGGTPYPGLGNTELFQLLKSGYRMERPDNCSEELYALMKKCWRTSPSARPSFTELKAHVENMMEAAEPNMYLSLMADIPSDYFTIGNKTDDLLLSPPCGGGGGHVEAETTLPKGKKGQFTFMNNSSYGKGAGDTFHRNSNQGQKAAQQEASSNERVVAEELCEEYGTDTGRKFDSRKKDSNCTEERKGKEEDLVALSQLTLNDEQPVESESTTSFIIDNEKSEGPWRKGSSSSSSSLSSMSFGRFNKMTIIDNRIYGLDVEV